MTISLNSTHDISGGVFPKCACLRLQLHCLLGFGSTGATYGATVDSDVLLEDNIALSHVIKAVVKDDSRKNSEKIKRLRNEFEMYRKLDASGYVCDNIPRCYGLYERDSMAVLLLEYVGEPLKNLDELSPEGW